ncbi:hypothetical protein AX17_000741 [Amanita inopinata Kibby_2008]|nr:hypothetical protein AX17_000741 [Amanita inopinata Kibby_2008]
MSPMPSFKAPPSVNRTARPDIAASAYSPHYPQVPAPNQTGGAMPQPVMMPPPAQMPIAQIVAGGQAAPSLHYLNCWVPDFRITPASAFKALPDYDPSSDYQGIVAACRGLGTNDSKVISVLVSLTPLQREALSYYFKTLGRDLLEFIASETSGYFLDGLTALIMGPIRYDVKMLSQALGASTSTSEAIMTEIILGRNNADLNTLQAAYQFTVGRALVGDVAKKLSGKVERLFIMTLSTERPLEVEPNMNEVEADVDLLYKACRKGVDEMAFIEVFTCRSYIHLSKVATLYGRRFKSLSKVIKKGFSGHLRDSLLYILRGVKAKRENPTQWRDAKRLEAAMAGFGTKDVLLVMRIIRAQWDHANLHLVKSCFERRYNKPLQKRVSGETSGAYRDLMIALVKCRCETEIV